MNDSQYEFISVFDIFKIGVGPSSSHTMGPWIAALQFAEHINADKVNKIQIELFGSLAKTGRGHGTDIAVMLGLMGYHPKTIDTSKIDSYIREIDQSRQINILGKHLIDFSPLQDIKFNYQKSTPHPNTATFQVSYLDGTSERKTYYSVGGGFIQEEGLKAERESYTTDVPYPINTYQELCEYIQSTNKSIPELVLDNECVQRSKEEVESAILQIWQTMLECVYKGCHTQGELPGGLRVKRRAQIMNSQLLSVVDYASIDEWFRLIKSGGQQFDRVNKWISCFALAVNEENASFGRVVTAPTNGASGVIPAVLMYMLCFCDNKNEKDIINFILTASEIGSLFKKGSTISAAMGGCQAEIGVSSAMAAAGLTQTLGGSTEQILMAAEISMEHHLGLTCDPIHGLVQIPCIERNTMGAIKAITASKIALMSDPSHAKVNLGNVIQTMWETAQDMNSKYKETSEGGLALSVIVPEC